MYKRTNNDRPMQFFLIIICISDLTLFTHSERVSQSSYQLVNYCFFREEEIGYSPCNLKQPNCVLDHHVSLQQMQVVWNTPCDNGLTRTQLIFCIIMNVIPKFTVGRVQVVCVQMIKTTQRIFNIIMLSIEICTVDQTLCAHNKTANI